MLRRVLGVIIALGALIIGMAALAGPAHARQAEATESIRGRVVEERLEDGRTVRTPVEGVRIGVTTPDGDPVGEAMTDEDGTYEIPLPEPGTYVLSIDEESIPEGVAVSEDQVSRPVSIRPAQRLVGNFFLGEDTRALGDRWGRLPQAVFDGLFFGLIIAITSVGLSLIYGTTGLANFSHGEMVTFGAIITWFADISWGLPFFVAVLVGLTASMAGGWAFDASVWRPLRRRGTGLTSQMIVSIGLALFFRQVWVYFYGGRTQSLSSFQQQLVPIRLGPIAIPPRVAWSAVICLLVLVGVAMFLLRTRFGKAVRAVSDNPDLASATGINTGRVVRLVWVLGGLLAGLGGVLLGLDQQIRWDSGANLLLLMFAAIVLGGLGNAFGALVGALVIGLSVEMSAWLFPSFVDLKRVGALAVLIVVLLVRPQGLLGRKERVG